MDKQFPVDGGADEKLAYLANQIPQTNLVESGARLMGPVWALCEDGSIRFIGAQVRAASDSSSRSIWRRLHAWLLRN